MSTDLDNCGASGNPGDALFDSLWQPRGAERLEDHTRSKLTSCGEKDGEAVAAMMPTVLIVEGEPLLRGFLTRVLRECGCAVDPASNYHEGLTRAQTRHYSLCLADANLPDGSGSDLCRQINNINTGVPAVFCYSYDCCDFAVHVDAQAPMDTGKHVTDRLQQLLNQLLGMGVHMAGVSRHEIVTLP